LAVSADFTEHEAGMRDESPSPVPRSEFLSEPLETLEQTLGHAFGEPTLLRQALTHRSYGQPHNERLEFLGDSVLNCAMASLLFERFGKLDEGDLSRLRSNLVKQQALVDIAHRLGLSRHLLLGEGEIRSGGTRRPSILGDTVEALIGAIFIDAGFDRASDAIRALYDPILKSVDPRTLGKDAKTLLQEHLQGKKLPLPVYAVVATHGAAHSQTFEVECSVPKLGIQVLGSGGSRRAAEQAAARLALDAAEAASVVTRRTRSTRQAAPDAPAAVAAQLVASQSVPGAVPGTSPQTVGEPAGPAAEAA
jgi:ribonuclease-3